MAKRIGRGFKSLRTRYVRRALYLSSHHAAFAEELDSVRKQWNERFPEHSITVTTSIATTLPDSVLEQISVSREERKQRTETEVMETLSFRVYQPLWTWNNSTLHLAEKYFPYVDFPNPYPYDQHPTLPFISASLRCFPHTVQRHIEDIFKEFNLEPEPMHSVRGELVFENIDPDDEFTWCIPVFPSVTAKDIEEAAPELAKRIERLYKGRFPEDRVPHLRAEGLTQQQVADTLGLDRKVVGEIEREVKLRDVRSAP